MSEGRSRQKLRTRRALIEAAGALIREGRTVTIAEAAEAAEVSLATAYRYFSSPQELLQETRLLIRTPDVTADLPAALVPVLVLGEPAFEAGPHQRPPHGLVAELELGDTRDERVEALGRVGGQIGARASFDR